MILGYNTNGLTSHRLEDGLRLLADEGFGAVAWTPDVPHLDPLHAEPHQISRIAKLLDDLGLVCVLESGARYVLDPQRKHRPNLLESDAGERRRRLDLLTRHLDIARDVGAKTLSLWSGALPADSSRSDAVARLEHGLDRLVEAGAQRDVQIGFEPEPGMLIETVDEAIAVLDAIGRPNQIGITLDIGHLYVTGEGSPTEIVPRIGRSLLQVHLEDMRRGVHEHLAPGDGDVDFAEVFDALADSGYRGPVCWELSRSGHAAPEMLRRCRACFDRHNRSDRA